MNPQYPEARTGDGFVGGFLFSYVGGYFVDAVVLYFLGAILGQLTSER